MCVRDTAGKDAAKQLVFTEPRKLSNQITAQSDPYEDLQPHPHPPTSHDKSHIRCLEKLTKAESTDSFQKYSGPTETRPVTRVYHSLSPLNSWRSRKRNNKTKTKGEKKQMQQHSLNVSNCEESDSSGCPAVCFPFQINFKVSKLPGTGLLPWRRVGRWRGTEQRGW